MSRDQVDSGEEYELHTQLPNRAPHSQDQNRALTAMIVNPPAGIGAMDALTKPDGYFRPAA